MAWDSGSALDRLSRTNEWIQSLRQRRKEANQGLFQGLLGQGLDVWKTMYGAQTQKEIAQKTPMWEWEADKQRLAATHKYKLAEMEKAHGYDMDALGEQGRQQILNIREEYIQRALEAEKKQDYDKEMAQLDDWYARRLEDLKFQNEKALIPIQAAAQKDVESSRGVSAKAQTKWNEIVEDAYQQARLAGFLMKNEFDQEIVKPDKVEQFLSYFVLPGPGGDFTASDLSWFNDKLTALKSSLSQNTAQAGPEAPPPQSTKQGNVTSEEVDWQQKLSSVIDKARKLADAGDKQAKSDLILFDEVIQNMNYAGTSWYLRPQDVPALQDRTGWQNKAKAFLDAYNRYYSREVPQITPATKFMPYVPSVKKP